MSKWPPICEHCENGTCSWIFSDLKGEALSALREALQVIYYEKGEIIFREHVPSHGAYIVCSGRVKVFQRSIEGKKLVIKLVGPAELLGEESLFGSETCLASAQALEPTRVKFISRAVFFSLMQTHPAMSFKLLEKLAQEIKAYRCKLLEIVYEGGRQKIARLLLGLEGKYGTANGPGSPLNARLSRSDLAEMAGMSTETIIRLLSELEDQGLVQSQGSKIWLLNRDALREMVEPMPVVLRENLI
jgi:CRP-like cAMP-binding protein